MKMLQFRPFSDVSRISFVFVFVFKNWIIIESLLYSLPISNLTIYFVYFFFLINVYLKKTNGRNIIIYYFSMNTRTTTTTATKKVYQRWKYKNDAFLMVSLWKRTRLVFIIKMSSNNTAKLMNKNNYILFTQLNKHALYRSDLTL